jgi:acyl-coenzyme A thioesterase PaaI-like protein
MQEIRNPYIGIEGYNCFGCAPHNTSGLRMRFFEEDDAIVCLWQPEDHFQGYPAVLHGGVQTALLDEAAAWAVYVQLGTSGFTHSIDIRFRRAAPTNRGILRIEARTCVQNDTPRQSLVPLATRLLDAEGNLCTEAEIVYFTYPEKYARRKLYYPGKDAFLRHNESIAQG